MRRLAAVMLTAMAAALHGCGDAPVRTVVIPPGPSLPEESALHGPSSPVPRPAAREPLPQVRNPGDAEGAALLAQRSLVVPVVGIAPAALRDHYDDRRGQRVHRAIDIMAPAGTPVVAVDDGRIVRLFTSRGGGLTVYQFDADGKLAYYYAHLQGYAETLAEGATIRRGW